MSLQIQNMARKSYGLEITINRHRGNSIHKADHQTEEIIQTTEAAL